MITRIRYTTQDTKLVSKPLLANTELVEVVIDTVANTYAVVKHADKSVIAGGTAVDLAVAKKKAKAAAATLGVVFQDEVRNRNVQV